MANEKKRSWLQSFMFEESDDSSTPVTNTSTVFNAPSPTISSQTLNVGTTQSIISSEKEKKVIESLLKLLDDSNLEGPDFYEYCIALKEMKTLGGNTDEATLFKMVYTTLKITGLTKQRLVESGNEYLKILSDYLKSFETNHEVTVQTKVGSKITEKSNVENLINQKTAQIESIQSEIIGLKNKQQVLDKEIQVETQNIEETKTSFISGYTKLVAELNSNLEKINKHIQ